MFYYVVAYKSTETSGNKTPISFVVSFGVRWKNFFGDNAGCFLRRFIILVLKKRRRRLTNKGCLL